MKTKLTANNMPKKYSMLFFFLFFFCKVSFGHKGKGPKKYNMLINESYQQDVDFKESTVQGNKGNTSKNGYLVFIKQMPYTVFYAKFIGNFDSDVHNMADQLYIKHVENKQNRHSFTYTKKLPLCKNFQ